MSLGSRVEKWVLLISGRWDKGREKVEREKKRGGGGYWLWRSLTLLVTNGWRNEKGSPGIVSSMDRQHSSSHCHLGLMAAGRLKCGSHKFDPVEVCRRLGNLYCYLLAASVTGRRNKLLGTATAVNNAGIYGMYAGRCWGPWQICPCRVTQFCTGGQVPPPCGSMSVLAVETDGDVISALSLPSSITKKIQGRGTSKCDFLSATCWATNQIGKETLTGGVFRSFVECKMKWF